jgi:hypothetical protein
VHERVALLSTKVDFDLEMGLMGHGHRSPAWSRPFSSQHSTIAF